MELLNIRAILLIFACVSCCVISRTALSNDFTELGNPIIRNYTTKEYRESAQIWTAVQDNRGVFYFGCSYHVVEFDGQVWRHIPVPSFPVRSLAVNRDGVIYVGLGSEFGYLASDANGEMKYVSLLDKLPEDRSKFQDVWDIHATSHGVYFTTEKWIFRLIDGSFEIIEKSTSRSYAVNDRLYIRRLRGDGIEILLNGKVAPLRYFTEKEKQEDFGRMVVAPWRGTSALIATEKKGLFVHHPNAPSKGQKLISAVTTEPSAITPLPSSVGAYLRKHSIYSVAKISETRFALGTIGGGIAIIDERGALVQIINKNSGLQDNILFELYLDNFGNLWAGTSNGISQIGISSPLSQYNYRNGIDATVNFTYRFNHTLYIATSNGIFLLPPYQLPHETDHKQVKLIENSRNQSFAVLETHGVLLASIDNSVVQISGATLRELISVESPIYTLIQSFRFPNLIFAGTAFGIAVLKFVPPAASTQMSQAPSDDGVELEIIKSDTLAHLNASIYKLNCDDNGDLWASTSNNGIFHLSWTTGDVGNVEVQHYGTADGLPGMSENMAYFLDHRLLVGTVDGIYTIDDAAKRAGEKRVRFVPEPTLAWKAPKGKGATRVIGEHRGQTWAIRDGEIDLLGQLRLSTEGKLAWDTRLSSMVSGELNSLYSDGDILWIGSSDGLYRLDTSKSKNYQADFNALIRKVTVANNRVINHGTYIDPHSTADEFFTAATLEQPFSMVPVLDYRDNGISVDVSATFFELPENNRFQYRLNGFDRQWSEWTTSRTKEYTNLPEGEFTFEVRAQNTYGHQSRSAKYRFAILPPWYRTIWAYLGYGVLGLIFFGGGIRLYTWRLVVSQKKLQQLVKHRTFEVESQKEEISAQADQLALNNLELKKLSIVAAETDNGVIIMDPQGNFEWINKSFTRMHGMTLEQLIAEQGSNLVQASQNPQVQIALEDCIDQKKPVTYESASRNAQGETIWTQTNLTPILNSSGEIEKLVAIDSDITEITQKREEIKQANQALWGEMRLAKKIQTVLLPRDPQIPGYEIAAWMNPADEVGGDYYDVIEAENQYWLVIGDVSGHGVSAGLVMMMAQTAIHATLKEIPHATPAKILNNVNDVICTNIERLGEDKYMTITMLSCRPDGELWFAGLHQDLLVYRTCSGEVEQIETCGMWIGLMPEVGEMFSVKQLSLSPGDTLLLYTDGIIEAVGENGEMFGEQKLSALLRNHGNRSAVAIREEILKSVQTYRCHDDVTLMVFQRK